MGLDAATDPSGEPTPRVQPLPRRRFLAVLAGFSVVSMASLVITPILGFLVPPKTSGGAAGGKVLVAKVADIPPGEGKVVPVGSKPTIIVNTAQGLKAYSAICTHLGCIVAYDPGSSAIVCPCHDGRFNPLNGSVLSGPPPTGLPPQDVSVEGDQIFVVST
jgi:cytochrome b6-f complex iron-sulfur subunit